jgi:hypothetical protein
MMTLLHELAHKKRLIYATKNNFLKKTPVKLNKEAGNYLEENVFGSTKICEELHNKMNKEIVKFIMDLNNWKLKP